jgi:hypothetical protein
MLMLSVKNCLSYSILLVLSILIFRFLIFDDKKYSINHIKQDNQSKRVVCL